MHHRIYTADAIAYVKREDVLYALHDDGWAWVPPRALRWALGALDAGVPRPPDVRTVDQLPAREELPTWPWEGPRIYIPLHLSPPEGTAP